MLFSIGFQLEYFLNPFNAFIYHRVVIFQMIGKMIGDFLDDSRAD